MLWPANTLLTVSVADGEYAGEYLVHVLGDGKYGLRTTVTTILTKPVPLPAGTLITCGCVIKERWWEFSSNVMGYEHVYPPCMVIAQPATVAEGTRRQFYRHEIELPVSYIAEEPRLWGERTVTLDLSIGGLQMATSQILSRSTPLAVQLDIRTQILSLCGHVAWSVFRGRQAYTGVHFTHKSLWAERVLSKFLLDLEREQLQRQNRIGSIR